MSRFVDQGATAVITLTDGDTVQVRQRLTASEEAVLQQKLITIHADMSLGDIKVEKIAWHLQRLHICQAYVTGWNFTDDRGQPVPFDPALVETLDADTVNEIATAVEDIQKKRRAQFQKKVPGS